MQHNKYQKCRTSRNWENFRKARNLVTHIKKQSIQNYFWMDLQVVIKIKTFGRQLNHLLLIKVPYEKSCFE